MTSSKPLQVVSTSASEGALQALDGLGCDAHLALAHKTRLAVRNASIMMTEQRARHRQTRNYAILAVCSLLVLLAPVIWNSVDVFINGEHLADLPVQVAVLLLVFSPAILGALIAAWKGQRDAHDDQRGF